MSGKRSRNGRSPDLSKTVIIFLRARKVKRRLPRTPDLIRLVRWGATVRPRGRGPTEADDLRPVRTIPENRPDRFVQNRVDGRRSDLSQGNQGEAPTGQPRVRDLQTGRRKHQVAGQEDVDVDRPGSVRRTGPSAHLSLDLFGDAEKRGGRKNGFDFQRLIEKPGLVLASDRLCPVHRGFPADADLEPGEPLGRFFQIPERIARVASEAQKVFHRNRANAPPGELYHFG